MRRVILFTSVILMTVPAGCFGGVSLGGAGSGGDDGGAEGGPDVTRPPEPDGASPDAPFTPDTSGPPHIDASEPSPNGCGGVCSGKTLPSTQVITLPMLQGTWSMCGGQLPIAGPNYGGLPADTAGFEFDAAYGTAYALVMGDGGALTRGIGPQYQWAVTLNYPAMIDSPNITAVNLTNNFSDSGLLFDVTYFRQADGCTAAMHFANVSSGENNEKADFVLASSGGPGACTACGPVCVYQECGGCSSAPPASATQSVSLSLTGVSFDGGSANGWESLGFNLDGKCTTASSTEVCTLQPGSSTFTQTDGTGGIDNSFGSGVCPIFNTLSNADVCSSISNAYVIIDPSGSGTMAVPVGNSWLEFPIQDAFVAQNGSAGGILGAVTPTTAFIAALQTVAGQFPLSLCPSATFESIANQVAQTSDILSTGSDDPGVPCDAISIGMTFTGSAPFGGPLPVVNSGCAADAGTTD